MRQGTIITKNERAEKELQQHLEREVEGNSEHSSSNLRNAALSLNTARCIIRLINRWKSRSLA